MYNTVEKKECNDVMHLYSVQFIFLVVSSVLTHRIQMWIFLTVNKGIVPGSTSGPDIVASSGRLKLTFDADGTIVSLQNMSWIIWSTFHIENITVLKNGPISLGWHWNQTWAIFWHFFNWQREVPTNVNEVMTNKTVVVRVDLLGEYMENSFDLS